jgi:hypothetical protein
MPTLFNAKLKSLLGGSIAVALAAFTIGAPSAAKADFIFNQPGSEASWIVPATGLYDITAVGADGGASGGYTGGAGATAYGGDIRLSAGQTLTIAVGLAGGNSYGLSLSDGGGGGGGSFVVLGSNTPLVIAGGGGGGGAGAGGGGAGGGGGGGFYLISEHNGGGLAGAADGGGGGFYSNGSNSGGGGPWRRQLRQRRRGRRRRLWRLCRVVT